MQLSLTFDSIFLVFFVCCNLLSTVMFARGWHNRFQKGLRSHFAQTDSTLQYLRSRHFAHERSMASTHLQDATEKRKIIFVLGGPGAGKGTQCEKLSAEYGITHLSAGELLRQEIRTGTAEGQLIDSYLKQGRIVPVEISLGLLKRKIVSTGKHRYLIDGFPRNHDNLNGWLKIMPEVCDIEVIVFLECDETELERRIIERGRTSNRSDDNILTAKKRFQTFQQETMPVVRHFTESTSAFNLVRINGDRPIDTVYADFKLSLQPFLQQELLHINQALNRREVSDVADVKATEERVEFKDLHATYNAYLSTGIKVLRRWKFSDGSWLQQQQQSPAFSL